MAWSRIGLGAWVFGRTGWGVQHDRDSRAAILRAIELGVTWIDTAAVYGDGHAERLVGTTLAELDEAERPLVFTKGGVRIDRASGATLRDLRPSSLREQCEASLRRLGVERIDLYQLHWPVDDQEIVEQAWETLAELRDEGKVDRAGVSNFDVGLLARCAGKHTVDTLQVPFSLVSRDAGSQLLPWASAQALPVLVYSPLESGLLSGRFSRERVRSLPDGDWRRRRRQFQQPRLKRTLELTWRLESIAADLGVSQTQLAIAWTLAWQGVSAAIVGARNAQQVEGWADAMKLSLDASTMQAIAAALVDTKAGEGPVHCTRQAAGPRGDREVMSPPWPWEQRTAPSR